MAPEVYNLGGHSMTVCVPRCAKTTRKTFFSVRVCNSWNSVPQHVIEAQSTNSFKNRLDKFWSPSDMGPWMLLLLSQSTSTSTSTIYHERLGYAVWNWDGRDL